MPDTPTSDPLRSTAREAFERAEAAKPEAWEAFFTIHGDPFVVEKGWAPGRQTIGGGSRTVAIITTAPEDYGRANTLFIAAARTDVPTLANAVLSQADTIDELRAEVEDLREQIPEDLSTCPYFARFCSVPGHDPEASCSFGCTDEPQCVTCQPSGGWPSQWPGIIERQTAELAELRAEVERLRQSNPLTFRLAADYVRIELDDDDALDADRCDACMDFHHEDCTDVEDGSCCCPPGPDRHYFVPNDWCVSCTLGEHKSCGGLYIEEDGTERECKCVHDGNEAGGMP